MNSAVLHDELNGRLHGFVNGETLNIPARVLYPLFSANVNNFCKLLFSKKELNLAELMKKVCGNNASSLRFLENQSNSKKGLFFGLDSFTYSTVLCTAYTDLSKVFDKKTKTLNQKMLPYTKWHTKAIQHPEQERLKALFELHDELRKHDEVFLALILQGSCANLDFTNFSDIDCIVVLRKKVLQNPTLLIHARNIIVSCRIYLDLFQPWNHHGFMIWSELDLENYRESLLPVALLKKSVLFSEGNTLFLHAISESEENLKVKVSKLIKKCERIKAMKPKNITELLDKIASCVLIPTLYLALQKKYTTKKDSFKQFLPLLSKTNQKMFWQVASVWKSWPFKESTPYGIRKRAHKLINPLLFKTFMFNKRNPNSIRKYAQILNKIDKLCDAYLALVRRNFDV